MLANATDSSVPTRRNQPIETRLSWGNFLANRIALGATIQIDTAEKARATKRRTCAARDFGAVGRTIR